MIGVVKSLVPYPPDYRYGARHRFDRVASFVAGGANLLEFEIAVNLNV